MTHANHHILAIDTSCDDTSVAVTSGIHVYSNIIASQTELHKPYGGVFPTVAKLAHREHIAPAVTLALKRARLNWEEIAAIAVTQGPGLAPALEVGIAYAKELAAVHQKPLIPVNHVEGHVLSVLARPATRTDREALVAADMFPALALVISGGHSEFVLVEGIGRYKILGATLDDAAGECLDKIGRMLNLGYPAGPVIETFAKNGDPSAYPFPLPLTTVHTYDLSFSGMKTFARNTLETLQQEKSLTKHELYNFCASAQHAVFRHITYKLNKILTNMSVQSIWLGGGVAANMMLRKMIRTTIKPYGLKLHVPYSKRLCADNAAMIGVVAGLRVEHDQQGIHAYAGNNEKIERAPRLGLTTTVEDPQ